jgi:hypothetical protein
VKSHQAVGSRSLRAIFAAPALLGVLTAAGLMSALLGDDVWDALSWLMLAAPIAVTAWFLCAAFRKSPRTARPSELP